MKPYTYLLSIALSLLPSIHARPVNTCASQRQCLGVTYERVDTEQSGEEVEWKITLVFERPSDPNHPFLSFDDPNTDEQCSKEDAISHAARAIPVGVTPEPTKVEDWEEGSEWPALSAVVLCGETVSFGVKDGSGKKTPCGDLQFDAPTEYNDETQIVCKSITDSDYTIGGGNTDACLWEIPAPVCEDEAGGGGAGGGNNGQALPTCETQAPCIQFMATYHGTDLYTVCMVPNPNDSTCSKVSTSGEGISHGCRSPRNNNSLSTNDPLKISNWKEPSELACYENIVTTCGATPFYFALKDAGGCDGTEGYTGGGVECEAGAECSDSASQSGLHYKACLWTFHVPCDETREEGDVSTYDLASAIHNSGETMTKSNGMTVADDDGNANVAFIVVTAIVAFVSVIALGVLYYVKRVKPKSNDKIARNEEAGMEVEVSADEGETTPMTITRT